jgi:hypothetical protein
MTTHKPAYVTAIRNMNVSRTRSGVLTLRFHTDGCPATSTGVTGGEGHARAASLIRLRGRVVKQPVRIARLHEAALGSGEGQFGVTPTRASADPMLIKGAGTDRTATDAYVFTESVAVDRSRPAALAAPWPNEIDGSHRLTCRKAHSLTDNRRRRLLPPDLVARRNDR